MATSVTSLTLASASDANYVLYAQAIVNSLQTVGLVQTSDTGQVDWDVHTTTPTASSYSLYQIWKTNDGLIPIYFKVVFGYYSGYNCLGFTHIGLGSDGSGSITDVITDKYLIAYTLPQASCSGPLYISSSPGGFAVVFNPSSPKIGYSFSFGFERSLDQSGSPTSDGFVFVNHGFGYAGFYTPSVNRNDCWRVAAATPGAGVNIYASPGLLPSPVGSTPAAMSTNTGLFPSSGVGVAIPIALGAPGVPPWISRQFMIVAPGDASAAGVYTASPYGIPNLYTAFGSPNPSLPIYGSGCIGVATNLDSCCAAIWWE